MPRFSFGYKLGEKNVIKGGYGIYFDTLNARDWTPNQDGFNVTTTNQLSNDFGQTFALGDPRNGILPLANPFPVRVHRQPLRSRSSGTRSAPTPCSAAASRPRTPTARTRACSGGAWAGSASSAAARRSRSPTPGRTPTGRGSPSARTTCPSSIGAAPTSATPRRTTSSPRTCRTRSIIAQLRRRSQTTNPLLYQRMLGSTRLHVDDHPAPPSAARVPAHEHGEQRSAYNDQPLGHDQVPLARGRPEPAVLQRPHRQRRVDGEPGHREPDGGRVRPGADAVADQQQRPAVARDRGRGVRAALRSRQGVPDATAGCSANIARGWTLGGTYEYQPGALLNWGNLFFNGDLNDIKKDNPEIALRPDGTFDPTKTWFNIDAGFERDTADQPAGFQKRVFPFRVDGVRGFRRVVPAREHRAHVQPGRPPDVPVPRGHPEPAQPAALRRIRTWIRRARTSGRSGP